MLTVIAIILFGFLIFAILIIKDSYTVARHQKQAVTKEKVRLQEANKVSKSTTLPQALDMALDEYDRAGIRIPLDIIEDLSGENFTDKEEAIKLIEMHRTNWKFENQKKLTRRK